MSNNILNQNIKNLAVMTLSELSDQIPNLRLNATKKFVLNSFSGNDPIEVYRTIPAKYIVSVFAWEKYGTQCQVLEITYQRKKLMQPA